MIRAALFDGPGLPFRLQELESRTEFQHRLHVDLCTLCGSDLHTAFGRRPGPTPAILGHEIVGTLETPGGLFDAVGAPLSDGTRVILGTSAHCGKCFYCTHDLPQKCERLFKYGHEAYDPEDGPAGGLATTIVLRLGSVLARVPESLPDAVAAPAGCAAATVFAAWNKVKDAKPETVVVLGLGMLGLTACAVAADAGSQVIGVDVLPDRHDKARLFGANDCVNPDRLPAMLRERTAGRGADLVLEFSGRAEACQSAVASARIGGTIVFVGAVAPIPPIAIAPEQWIRRCLTLIGVHNYAPRDLADAVSFLTSAQGRYPFAGLLERVYPLMDVNRAFADANRESGIRIGVNP